MNLMEMLTKILTALSKRSPQWNYREITNGYVVTETMPSGRILEHFVEGELDALRILTRSTRSYYDKAMAEVDISLNAPVPNSNPEPERLL